MSSPSDPIDSAGLAAIAAALATGFGSQPDQEQAGTVKQTTDALTFLPRDWPEEVPAKLTAWDAGTQRATWAERDWDANGLRKDKLRGLFGNATFCPAKPVGNGLMPPDSFPVDVILRRRCAVKGLGVVYEFDWVCACAGAGSGTGSGTQGVLTGCCPGAIPRTLTFTIHLTSGTCAGLDGATVTVTTVGNIGIWTNGAGTVIGGSTWLANLNCDASGWHVNFTTGEVGCSNNNPVDAAIVSCAPLHLTAAGFSTGVGCPTCPSITYDVTVTE